METLINSIYNDFITQFKPFIGNDTTRGDDLSRKGRKIFGNRFKGVFASDELPNLQNNQMYIANLDTSNETGSHWIGVYKKNDIHYVYDSFGRPTKKILNSLHGHGKTIKDTEYDAEQSKSEDNCGLRSMVALYMFDNFDPEIVAEHL